MIYQDTEITAKVYQKHFLNSTKKFPIIKSAWGTGKTMFLILKAVKLCEDYPGNVGVLFRKEYTDLRDSTIKDFELYTGLKVDSQREAKIGKSVIMFRHLEELNNIQNMNLGFFGIEQAEELESDIVFYILLGRLRKEGTSRQGMMIANAKGHNWIYKIKKEGIYDPETKERLDDVVEATSYDNKDIIPADTFRTWELLKEKKPNLYNRFVLNSDDEYGDESVFDKTKLQEWLNLNTQYKTGVLQYNDKGLIEFKETVNGNLRIYEQPVAETTYCIGVDVSEGIQNEDQDRDWSVASVKRHDTWVQVAKYKGRIKPDALADMLNLIGRYYNTAIIGVEINNHGLTTLTTLQREHKYPRLYFKEVLDEATKQKSKKFGWQTTSKTKPLLIDSQAEAISEGKTKIVDIDSLKEHFEFIMDEDGLYHAPQGLHDDEVIADAICTFMCKSNYAYNPTEEWSAPEHQMGGVRGYNKAYMSKMDKYLKRKLH